KDLKLITEKWKNINYNKYMTVENNSETNSNNKIEEKNEYDQETDDELTLSD
ncbi:1325_t:CDS:1, partial [Cetraspora pellucida]